MKKFVSFILTMSLVLSMLSFTIVAAVDTNNVFVYDNKEIAFYSDDLSYSEMKRIADCIADEDESGGVSTLGILCTLLGHNLSTSYVKETVHSVYSTSPKCVVNQYTVQSCSRCDYIEKTLTDTMRITCH